MGLKQDTALAFTPLFKESEILIVGQECLFLPLLTSTRKEYFHFELDIFFVWHVLVSMTQSDPSALLPENP